MAIEYTGPGGISNSYGRRTTRQPSRIMDAGKPHPYYWGMAVSVQPAVLGAPSQVAIGEARTYNQTAIVSYSAPLSQGASPITGYTATSSPGGLTGTVSGPTPKPITVSGLTPGVAYTFTVVANNATGPSPVSDVSNPVVALSGPVQAFLGAVASGTHTSNYISGANKYIGVTSEHTMADSVTSFKLVYANFYVAGAGEVNGAAMTASVGVEYPAGVFTRVNFGGSAAGAFAAGAVTESDFIPVAIPAGAKFKVHAKLGWPTGFFIATSDMSYHVSTRFSAGAADGDIPDYSLGGGEWNVPAVNTTSYVHTPIAIVANTTKPSVALFGSSTPRGFNDLTISTWGITGYLARAFAPNNAVMNLAVSGDSFTNSQNSRTKRLNLFKYVTHVVPSVGTNDIYGTPAWNSTQVINAYTALVSAIGPTKKTWIALYQPRNTGSWGSDGTQVINSTFEGYRVAVNNAVKAGIAGAAGYIDALSATETNVNPESGLWRSDGGVTTPDGIHINSFGSIRAAGLVPASSIMSS